LLTFFFFVFFLVFHRVEENNLKSSLSTLQKENKKSRIFFLSLSFRVIMSNTGYFGNNDGATQFQGGGYGGCA